MVNYPMAEAWGSRRMERMVVRKNSDQESRQWCFPRSQKGGTWCREKAMNRRVVVVASYAPSIVMFRGALIRELVDRGAKVYVLAPNYTDKIRAKVRALGAEPLDYPLNRTGMNPFQDIKSLLALWSWFRRLDPDLIFSYTAKPVVYGTLAAWMARVPRRVALVTGLGYAFTENGDQSSKRFLMQGLLGLLYAFALAKAHRVIFQNPDDQKEFISKRLVPSGKTLVIGGTGVALGDWPPAPPHLSPMTFTLIARLLKEKGVREFVEAARQVRARHPGAGFLLIGPLDSNPGAISGSEVREWVKEGTVEWVPWTDDVRPCLARTSVYVLPSYYREGVPRSTQEAMAMARPVITTDVPGCRETVVDGRNGFLVPPRDVGALVEAMERFIRNPELIGTMGEASRELAEDRFDARKINERFLEVLGLG